jgi:hypothetical protein
LPAILAISGLDDLPGLDGIIESNSSFVFLRMFVLHAKIMFGPALWIGKFPSPREFSLPLAVLFSPLSGVFVPTRTANALTAIVSFVMAVELRKRLLLFT